MRRFCAALLCCLMLCSVVAASEVSQMQTALTVDGDGSCTITMTVQLELDDLPGSLVFPVPANAKNISLNGHSVRGSLNGNVRNVSLRGAVAASGTQTLVLRYTLPHSISADKSGRLHLNIDLLCGFAYPIQALSGTVSLPGPIENRPAFTSTYYQESVDTIMDIKTEGSTLQFSFTKGLNDHEKLSMDLVVPAEQFPDALSHGLGLGWAELTALLLLGLAWIYWLITMRTGPVHRVRRATEPEGFTAGELGCCLTGSGVDWTLMVLSWAQMGYLRLQLDGNGRVLLHKRMEMGNERSKFENKYFNSLFGKRNTVDGTGFHYAQLADRAAKTVLHRRSLLRKGSGSPKIFHTLCLLAGGLSGVSLAVAFTEELAWQILLGLLLFALGVAVSWLLQQVGYSLHLRKPPVLLLSAGACVLWLLLGLWSDALLVAGLNVLVQLVSGVAAAYGGLKTERGKQAATDVLSLRQFLRKAPTATLEQILNRNPDYYYRLAPYALALGVDRTFARRLGGRRLPGCPYLITTMDGHLTAAEWNRLLRTTVDALDERRQKMPLKRILSLFGK